MHSILSIFNINIQFYFPIKIFGALKSFNFIVKQLKKPIFYSNPALACCVHICIFWESDSRLIINVLISQNKQSSPKNKKIWRIFAFITLPDLLPNIFLEGIHKAASKPQNLSPYLPSLSSAVTMSNTLSGKPLSLWMRGWTRPVYKSYHTDLSLVPVNKFINIQLI